MFHDPPYAIVCVPPLCMLCYRSIGTSPYQPVFIPSLSLSHGIANAMSLTIERNQVMVVPLFVRASSSVSAVFFLAVVFPPPSKSSC